MLPRRRGPRYKRDFSFRGERGWVCASREGARSGTARWLVKAPGGTWKIGGKWKRAARVGSHVEKSWGRDGHTGPKHPHGTKLRVQLRGLATKACVTLKRSGPPVVEVRGTGRVGATQHRGMEHPVKSAPAPRGSGPAGQARLVVRDQARRLSRHFDNVSPWGVAIPP